MWCRTKLDSVSYGGWLLSFTAPALRLALPLTTLKEDNLGFFSSKNIKPEFIFVLLLVAKHFSSGCKGLSKAFSLREKVTSFLKNIKSVLQNHDFPSNAALPLTWTSVLLSAKLGNNSGYFIRL